MFAYCSARNKKGPAGFITRAKHPESLFSSGNIQFTLWLAEESGDCQCFPSVITALTLLPDYSSGRGSFSTPTGANKTAESLQLWLDVITACASILYHMEKRWSTSVKERAAAVDR